MTNIHQLDAARAERQRSLDGACRDPRTNPVVWAIADLIIFVSLTGIGYVIGKAVVYLAWTMGIWTP
jgi:hypothetical protein